MVLGKDLEWVNCEYIVYYFINNAQFEHEVQNEYLARLSDKAAICNSLLEMCLTDSQQPDVWVAEYHP